MIEKAPGFNQILEPIGDDKPKLEKAPGYGATQVSPTPPEQTTPFAQYSKGYIYGSSLKDHIAASQGKWDETANAVVQTASEAVLGTLESTSYILDFKQHWDHLNGSEQEYSNAFADAMKQAKASIQERVPIYTSEENETFQPGNYEWWAKQSPSVIGTALSLLLPAAGISKLGKLAGLGKTGQAVLATFSSRLAENTMEANQTMQEALAKGAAKEDAAKQAANVWNTNWAFAATDFLEFTSMFKGFSSAAKGAKGSVIGELGKVAVAEAGEEAGQYVAQQEGVNAAVNKTDHFGKGFKSRLADYIESDEFKTSALLGAVGGAVMVGGSKVLNLAAPDEEGNSKLGKAVDYFKSKVSDLTKRGLAKEQANYKGDTGTSEKITNEDFAKQVIGHMNSGSLPLFKEALATQAKAPDAPQEVREYAENFIKDTDFVIDQQAKLKAAGVSSELHIPIITTQLELRQNGRLTERLEKELNHLEGEVQKSKELDPSLTDLKKLQLAAHAYAELAKTNPKFLPKALELDAKFLEQVNSPMTQALGINMAEALHTTQDDTLAQKTFQLISTQEKSKELKKDSYNLSTPEGQAGMALARQNKKEAQQAEGLVTNKETTKAQLQEAAEKTKQPEVKARLDQAITQKVEEEKETNKQQTEAKLNEALPTEVDESLPDLDFEAQEVDETQYVPEDIDAEVEKLEAGQAEESVLKAEQATTLGELFEAVEREQPGQPVAQEHQEEKKAQVAVQQVKDKDTVITRLKQLAGKWVNGVFETEKDQYGVPIQQEYFDNETGKRVAAYEVFDADSHGNLVVNTPLVKEGDAVILKVVDNGTDKKARYSLTPGFRPTGEHNWVIQVFRVDKAGRAYQKPLTELPSADSPQGNDAGTLTNLRKAVITAPNGILSTTISGHSIGDVRVSSMPHSLEVFTHDYTQNEEGEWEFKKLKHKPIIAVVKLNNDIVTPNLDRMANVPKAIHDSVRETEVRDRGSRELAPGTRYVYRTNPQGNQQLVALQGRNLSPAEITWLKQNLTTYFKTGDLEALSDVLYVKKNTQGIFSTQKGSKERDIVKASGRQLILLQNTKGNPTVLVPLTQAKNHNQWIHLSLNEFDNLVNDKPFSYQKVNPANGEMTNRVYSSTKEGVEKVGNIQKAVSKLFTSSFRNMRDDRLNDEHDYTDPVTNEKYETYYNFLVKTETATVLSPGSTGIGFGGDNSYSFHNSGLRLNTISNPVTVEQTTKGVVLEDKAPVPPSEPKKTEGLSRKARITKQTQEKLRPASKEGFETITNKEYEWFTSIFGESSLEVIKDVDRILSKGGKEAFGIYHNALVKLAELGETGTLYHEAFHFVFDPQLGLITQGKRESVLENARQVYGRKSEGNLEELLAEDFRKYQLNGGTKVPEVKKSEGFFRRLYNAIKKLLGIRTPIENLFRNINSLNPTIEQRLFFAEARRKGLNDSTTDEKTRLLPGFVAYSQQVEAVNVSAYRIMNYLWNWSKKTSTPVEDLMTGRGIEKGDTKALDQAFDILREKFKSDYERIHSIPRDERSDSDYTRHDSYLSMGVVDKINNPDDLDKEALGKWEDVKGDLNVETGFKTEILKQFSQFGFRVILGNGEILEPKGTEESEPVTEELSQDDLNELADSEKKDDAHGIDVTMKDPVKGLSQSIKMFLAQIPDPNRKTSFNLPVPINFNKVFGNLSVKLAGSKIPLVRLAELAKTDDLLNTVYTKLIEEQQAGNTKLINEFNTRFNLTHANLQTFIDEYRDGIHTARMIDTNRNSSDKALLAKWQEGFINNLVSRNGEIFQATVTKYLNKVVKLKEQYITDQNSKQNKWSYEKLKGEFVTFLKDLKVIVPDDVWTELEKLGKNQSVARKTIVGWMFAQQADSLFNFFKGLQNSNSITDGSLFNRLAERSKLYVDNSDGGVFLDDNKKQRFPVNLPSTASEFVDRVKNGEGREIAAFYEQDHFYKGNAFIEMLKDEVDSSEFEKKTGASYRKGDQDAKEFDERTPGESALMRMIAFYNNGGNYGSFFLGTHEAKQKSTLLTLKKVKDNAGALEFLKRVLTNTAKGEVTRINRLRSSVEQARKDEPKASDLAIFNKRGKQFLYIPELNKVHGLAARVTEGEISPAEARGAWTEAGKVIDQFIEEQYNGFIDELITQGVLDRNKSGKLINKKIPVGIMEAKEVETFLKNFFYNDLAWRIETSKVFNGDLAFYKSDDDYFKRGYQTVTPGTKPYNDPNKPTTLRTVVLEKQTLPGVKSARDSQTILTMKAYKAITEPLGQWSKEHELIYQFAWKDNLTLAQAMKAKNTGREQGEELRAALRKVATPPLKPFQFSTKVITLLDGDKMVIKEQVKDSRAALNPEFANRHPEYKKLLTWMNTHNIDVAIDEDAVKVGKYGVTKISETPEPWQIREHNLDDLRLPQMNSNQRKEEIAGSQYHKLITANVDLDGDYDGIKGKTLLEKRSEAWAEVLKTEAVKLQEKITGKDQKETLQKIKALIEQELMSRQLNENYTDSLKLVLNQMGQPQIVASLAFPLNSTKFVGTLTNLYKKFILNPKSPGFAGVNLADFIDGAKSNSNLKFVTNEKGKVTEAEIGMPVRFFEEIGLNYRDFTEFVDGERTGKIDWEKLSKGQQEALQAIVYRIPTSNKSSMTPVRIVMVIHPSEGEVVMLPPEMLTQQGLDFDYDKSQVLLRPVKDGKVDKDNPHTTIFDLDWSILTSQKHINEVLTPLTSDKIKAISDTYKAKEQGKWLSPMNPARDITAEEQNRDSKIMVGTFSRFNTAHSVLQTIKDYVTVSDDAIVDISVPGYKFDQLGRVKDSKGNLISENFGEYQSAALDAGKDPLLYYLSVNKNTSTLVSTMLLYGVDPAIITSFFKQPVITSWLNNVKRENNSNKALEAVLEDTPGLRTKFNEYLTGKRSMKLTEDALTKSLATNLKDNIEFQARVLAEFSRLQTISRAANNLSSVLSIDTFQDMTGMENLEAKLNQAASITEEDALIKVEERVFDLNKAPKEAKRLAAFYQYAIKDALVDLNQFFPYTTPPYWYTKEAFEDITGTRLFNPKSIKKLNQFLDFYNLETNNAIVPVLNKVAPNYQERWLFTDADKSIFEYIKKVQNTHPELASNKFVNSIRSISSQKGRVQMIGVNNSNSRLNKTELTQAWRDLMLDDNAELQLLAYDLVRFAIYSSGFGYNARSFADLIPIDFFIEQGITESHYALLNNRTQLINSTGAVRSFIRHNFKNLDEIPEEYVRWVTDKETKTNTLIPGRLVKPILDARDKHIKEFIIPSDSVNLQGKELNSTFVKIDSPYFVNGKKFSHYRLYESNPLNPSHFKEVQPLGEDRAFYEVQADGNNQSKIPFNQENHGSPDPWATNRGVEPEELEGLNYDSSNEDEGTLDVPDCNK